MTTLSAIQASQRTVIGREPLTGIATEAPVRVQRDRLTFDGNGSISNIDLADGGEITLRSQNQKDSFTIKATVYEFGVDRNGPFSFSLPGLEGKLTTSVADTEVSVRGGVSLGSIAAPGVFSERDADGRTHYRLEAGPLGMDFRDADGLLLLDGAVAVTDAAYGVAQTAADLVMGAADGLGDTLDAAWRWATDAPPPTPVVREAFRASPTARGEAGDIARDAMFLAPFAKAAYAGTPTPDGATPVDIHGLFDASDGFSADLFKTRMNGRDTMVLAFRGTEPAEANDWLTNFKHLFAVPSQYVQAVNLASAVRAKYPDADVMLTGHSLGGGLASFAGLMTGTRAYSFNGAGPLGPTRELLPTGSDRTLVTHINTESDPLTGAFGRLAGSPWGATVCTIREESVAPMPNAPEGRESLRNRVVGVAQWFGQHSVNSVVAKLLSVPGQAPTELDCIREHR